MAKQKAQKGTFKAINIALYAALFEIFNCHVQNGGKVDIGGSNSFDWLNQTLDYIKIKYFGEEPDGDAEQELANDGTPMIDDEKAYFEMVTRLNNIEGSIFEIKKEKS